MNFTLYLLLLLLNRMHTSDIEERVNELGILTTLVSQPADFTDRMKTYVYPTLEGTDHSCLIYYYSLLDKCQIKHHISPDIHIKLLKKLKPAAPGKPPPPPFLLLLLLLCLLLFLFLCHLLFLHLCLFLLLFQCIRHNTPINVSDIIHL